MKYLVRGLDAEGAEFFYTGRAGSAWISRNRSEAFRYETAAAARKRALLHNTRMALHGFRFIALAERRCPLCAAGERHLACG